MEMVTRQVPKKQYMVTLDMTICVHACLYTYIPKNPQLLGHVFLEVEKLKLKS